MEQLQASNDSATGKPAKRKAAGAGSRCRWQLANINQIANQWLTAARCDWTQ
jgi:hypothetical protein